MKRLIKKFLYMVLLSVALVSPVAQAKFTLVATHPEASRTFPVTPQANKTFQLSHKGRELKVLRAYKNRLYIGYGQDDGPNKPGSCVPYYVNLRTGAPWCALVVRYYDPSTGRLSRPQGYLRSQQLSTLEVLNGSLFGLAEDQEGRDDFLKCSASGCRGGAMGFEKPAHLYSAAALNGAIYMAGSIGRDGAVWKSTDNGNRWVETLRLSAIDPVGDFARIHDVGGPFRGRLYARARDWSHGYQSVTKKYNGNIQNSWQSQASGLETFLPTFRKREFAGKLIFIEGLQLKEFDGSQVIHNYRPPVYDYTIVGEWLYVLHTGFGGNKVMRTKDLTSWRYVDTAPSDAISLEVLGDSVFVGTKNAQIFESKIPEPGKVPLSPILFLLLND